MSVHLYWRPVVPEKRRTLPMELRNALARRLWDHDGSLCSGTARLDEGDYDYLNGLSDGGVPGVDALLDAIGLHGTVEIWIAE